LISRSCSCPGQAGCFEGKHANVSTESRTLLLAAPLTLGGQRGDFRAPVRASRLRGPEEGRDARGCNHRSRRPSSRRLCFRINLDHIPPNHCLPAG
jgi:hypothetical protein